jgi:hypothetical protein
MLKRPSGELGVNHSVRGDGIGNPLQLAQLALRIAAPERRAARRIETTRAEFSDCARMIIFPRARAERCSKPTKPVVLAVDFRPTSDSKIARLFKSNAQRPIAPTNTRVPSVTGTAAGAGVRLVPRA